ncbi:MAG: carboxypeptidase-like regulatory domain-containing protein [Chitinophagaceae bacterium]|nr:carboxypeptidase-like regulatory domain-containing protein [Chitinophagaceae bacterium]MCB9045901.1 carboxypeptidase-like regulatory domain-containing protein [Chitinophagales bacterium]
MKQPKTIQLSIPQPCTEDWHKMTPQQQGRNCDSCRKCVVDFTGFTDEQLYNFFIEHKGQKVCGRVKKTQLNRPILLPPQPHSTLYKWIIAAGLALIITVGSNHTSFAQVPYKNKAVVIEKEQSEDSVSNESINITGTIVDEHNEPVIFAVIQIFKDSILKGGTTTNEDGKFSISIQGKSKYTLIAKYVGYEEEHIQISTDSSLNNIVIKLQTNINIDEVYITSGYVVPLIEKIPIKSTVEIKRKTQIDKFEGGNSKTIYSDEIEHMGH